MALVTCPECGNKVSSVAKQCVRCGYPIGMVPKSQLVDNILLDATIEQLNLSIRTYRILSLSNIRTVRDITDMTFGELTSIKGMGKKSAEEIFARIRQLGLCIKDGNYDMTFTPLDVTTKLDWKCERASKNMSFSEVLHSFTSRELSDIRRGFRPHSMEDKWFIYYEHGVVYFYRSWTGVLVYALMLNEETNMHVLITYYNSEEERKDLEMVNILELIDYWTHKW